MNYIVSADELENIDFAPGNTVKEVLQNVRTLLTTIRYETPLDRELGIPGEVVDKPMPQSEAILSSVIFSEIKKYEPRAELQSISFTRGMEGKLVPKVEVRINESE